MAIDRGPWNALIDDDGSNLVGTVWNKDKIKTVILDPTDAAIAGIVPPTPNPAWTMANSVAGGVLNNFDPGIVGHTIVTMSGGSGPNITGLKPAAVPFIGQIVRIISVPGPLVFFHEHSGSDAAYRFHLRASSATITGFWGIIEFQYMTFSGVGGWAQGASGNGQ